MPPPRSRTKPRTQIPPTRRLSLCYRHPDDPISGICPSCLRERLSGLDPSPAPAPAPKLRRSKSVISDSIFEPSSSSFTDQPRRKSCDVVPARNSLSNLFDAHDDVSESDLILETKNVGLSRVTYTVIESKSKEKDLDEGLGKFDSDLESEESKTMKEYIDLECKSKVKKSKDVRVIAGSLLSAASVFSKKLRKWRVKNSKKVDVPSSSSSVVGGGGNGNGNLNVKSKKIGGSYLENVGRRSCDMEPRYSVDAGRISFEEPRASWDGYMIARTIPRLAPMFTSVENGGLGNISKFENHRLSVDGTIMHSIIEDESTSGGSGNSNSDSSSSMRRSSFDRSSSVRSFAKKAMGSDDHGASPGNVKLVITEKELKDWHLSRKDDGLERSGSVSVDTAVSTEGICNLNVPARKSVTWRKVCNVFGFKTKDSENDTESVIDNTNERKPGKEDVGNLKDDAGWKLTRSSSVVGSRNACDVLGSTYRRRSVDNAGEFKLDRNTSTKYSSTELGDGILPFYMTPLRSMRNSTSGMFKLHSSHPISGNVLQLN